LMKKEKSSKSEKLYPVDLKKISAKGEVDKDLWAEIQKGLRGDPEEVKKAIELFFENYKSLPSEADDLICEYAQKDQPYEYRLLIASLFTRKDIRITFGFSNNLLDILEKDDDKKIQELIADKLEERKKFQEEIRSTFKELSKSLLGLQESYKALFDKALIQSFQSYQSLYSETLTAFFNTYKNAFFSYYAPRALSGIVVPERVKDESAAKLIRELQNCPKGKGGWNQYQRICERILEYLFVPPLGDPISQSRTENGAHIRDFILQIPVGLGGFWGFCQMKHNSIGLLVECKDYTDQIEGNDIVVTSKYLHEKRIGNFGIVACRETPSESAIHEAKRLWREDEKFIVVLTDDDLITMIRLKENGDEPEKIVEQKAFDLRISLD